MEVVLKRDHKCNWCVVLPRSTGTSCPGRASSVEMTGSRKSRVKKLRDDADFTLVQMDDLAVLVLFSVFESQVRDRLATELTKLKCARSRSAIPFYSERSRTSLSKWRKGSFFKGLGPFISLSMRTSWRRSIRFGDTGTGLPMGDVEKSLRVSTPRPRTNG